MGSRVADLTAAQAEAVCKELSAKTRALESTIDEFTCTTQGIIAEAQAGGDCAGVTQDCIDANSPEAQDCSVATDEMPACPELTLGEYRACLDASLAPLGPPGPRASVKTS